MPNLIYSMGLSLDGYVEDSVGNFDWGVPDEELHRFHNARVGDLGGQLLGLNLVRAGGLVWCAVLTVPLAALFSALCLALGVYARSTKEGQYYLLPIFLGTMPLVLFSLAPGLELTWRTSLIPVTGLCLLLQKLIFPPPEGPPWEFALPVVLSLAVCIAVALRWAVAQFHREDVLFREADRPGWRLRLRTLFPGQTGGR